MEKDDVAASRLASGSGHVSWAGPPLPFLCPCGRHSYDHSIQEIGTGRCQRSAPAEGKERSDHE